MDMNDWERQRHRDEMERLGRENNQALEASNRIEADKISAIKEQTAAIRDNQRLQQERLWAEERQREREREARIEQGYKDRIYSLRTAIAQTTDPYQEAKLQGLLSEAQTEYEDYQEEKRRQEEEARLRAEKYEQERLRTEALRIKQKRREKIWRTVVTLLTVLVLLFGAFLLWGFWENSRLISTVDKPSASMSDRDNQETEIAEEPAQSGGVTESSTSSQPTSVGEFSVDVTVTDLNIRESPSHSGATVRVIPIGTYTIVETVQQDNHVWGRLKSGEGWISLTAIGQETIGVSEASSDIGWPSESNVDVDQNNLTTKQVENWVRAAFMRKDNFSEVYDPKWITVTVQMAEDGLVYADLIYLHDNPWHYRINDKGQLERQNGGWKLEAETYFDNW